MQVETQPAMTPPTGAGRPDAPLPARPTDRGPGFGTALLVILLCSLPLLALLYLGAQLLGLPFVPFDLTDALGRAGLPFWVRAIESLESGLVSGGASPAAAITTGRWVLGLLLFGLLAYAVGLGFYLLAVRRGRVPDTLDGVVAGVILGVPMILASLAAGGSTLPALIIVVWLGALALVWGIALSYAFERLVSVPIVESPAVQDETAEPASAEATGGMGRRQFLVQFGVGAAALTAAGATAGALLSRREDARELQRTLPVASPELLEAEKQLFGNFRRFALVRPDPATADGSRVVALGAEYPDRNYVSVWLGGRSPIVVYENLESAAVAYGTEDAPAGIYWLDN